MWLEKGNNFNVETGIYDNYKKFGPGLRGDNYPIIGISWHDAYAYCDWLSKRTGFDFKLPTEAQWEKAARGTDCRKYPWGNIPPSGKKINYADKQLWLKEKYYWTDKNIDDGYVYTAPVGSYSQGNSPYGLQDMEGNVSEWCSDWYRFGYYKNAPKKNPGGPEDGSLCVVRGSSWHGSDWMLRCTFRDYQWPHIRNTLQGFRLCQDVR